MRKSIDPKRNEAAQKIIAELTRLEGEAAKAGLFATMHAINNAKNAIGWELAGETLIAAQAGRGIRPGDLEYDPGTASNHPNS